MKNVVTINPFAPEIATIERAAAVLRAGGLVAFPTETVYGLGANALDAVAVRKIFAVKKRPHWDPLIVHVNGEEMARELAANLPTMFYDLVDRFWPGPLTCVVEKRDSVPAEVTAGRSTVALRMPRHPVIGAVLATAKLPIAGPSANTFGAPSPTRAEHVVHDLGDQVDLILNAGPTPLGVESTVLDLTRQPPTILRPGGLCQELIEAVIGPVAVAPGVTEQAMEEGLASPGTTSRHYSPQATVEVFEHEAALQSRATQLRSGGHRVAVLESNENLDQYAHVLYERLREFDDDQAEYILCRLPPPAGIGLAIRDRLRRAAGLAARQ